MVLRGMKVVSFIAFHVSLSVSFGAWFLQVTTIVEQKLSAKEFDKYRSYVDELEKMLYLILKLSERLAKAENAVQALAQNASDREKV